MSGGEYSAGLAGRSGRPKPAYRAAHRAVRITVGRARIALSDAEALLPTAR
jgi:hypothetical protein